MAAKAAATSEAFRRSVEIGRSPPKVVTEEKLGSRCS